MEKYKVRRYGFTGQTTAMYQREQQKFLDVLMTPLKQWFATWATAPSISAVLNGKSVDTSMGLTPLEGLVMEPEAAMWDPGALQFIMHKENMDIDQMLNVLNKKSGVYGMSGVSSDFRDVENACK